MNDEKKPDRPSGKQLHEIVLPNGQFARIHEPTWFDISASYNQNPMFFMTLVATRIVTIDGEVKPYLWYLEQPASTIAPITKLVGEVMGDVNKFGKGVA